jgi:hypothetical protein
MSNAATNGTAAGFGTKRTSYVFWASGVAVVNRSVSANSRDALPRMARIRLFSTHFESCIKFHG